MRAAEGCVPDINYPFHRCTWHRQGFVINNAPAWDQVGDVVSLGFGAQPGPVVLSSSVLESLFLAPNPPDFGESIWS